MVDDLKIMLTVICINYLGKSEKNVICIIIWNAVYEPNGNVTVNNLLMAVVSVAGNYVCYWLEGERGVGLGGSNHKP